MGTFAGLLIIGGAIWLFSTMFGGSGSTVSTAKDYCADGTMAFVMSQNAVKKQLTSPASADFPYINGDGVSVTSAGNCTYSINAYVDSKNALGVMLRSHYSATVSSADAGKTWQTQNLVIR